MEGVVLYAILVKVFVKAVQKRYCIAFTMISYGKRLHLYSNILEVSNLCNYVLQFKGCMSYDSTYVF